MEKMQRRLLKLAGYSKITEVDRWYAPGCNPNNSNWMTQAQAWAAYDSRFLVMRHA
jgi:hypothetical protein